MDNLYMEPMAPKELKVHHTKLIVSVVVLAVVAVFIIVAAMMYQQSVPFVSIVPDPYAAKKAQLADSRNNPPQQLSAEEASAKQAQLKASNPKTTLTAEQASAKKATLGDF